VTGPEVPLSELEVLRSYFVPAVQKAQDEGPLPTPGSTAWVNADHDTKMVAVVAEYLGLRQARELAKLVGNRNRRVAREDRRDFLVAQREASHAVSGAVDWSAVSRRPSHAELVKRRAVVGVPR
jgi:hypothetical protein